MSHLSPEPSLTSLSWVPCGQGTTPEDPVGCRGADVPGHTACLAHLADAERDAYLYSLPPGADIDHSGTTFTDPLLDSLLDALRDPATGFPRLGDARFISATFQGNAEFEFVTFQGEATFRSAIFKGDAEFGAATFQSDVEFRSTTFKGDAVFQAAIFACTANFTVATFQSGARFDGANFQGGARFDGANFQGNAEFASTDFQGDTGFVSVAFQRDARFELAVFQGDARFEMAVFERAASLGPFVCAGRVKLSGAVFGSPVTLSLAARRLECRRTRWSSTAEIRLRYATVDFAQAVFEYPLTIAAEAEPFSLPAGQPVSEQALADAPSATVRMISLRGVDAAHLVLSDINLAMCMLTGTVHLDQIQLEGTCSFNDVPRTQWRRWPPVRFTQRRILFEERIWRVSEPAAAPGWNAAVSGTVRVGPAQLAPVYRALRKAFEDGKNEPGAADFYYGEMEMRRHDRINTTRAERGLLSGYWLLSGYGLRASRALGWLAAAMLVTVVLLVGFGLPKDSPKQEATGTVPPGGGKVTFEIGKADPQNPTGERFTGERFDKAINVTLNSVVFRSSGQDLTTTGTYIEMTSRVTEPVLLGLAVLAVRNRVKR
ncbi:pentapeptide repeat-containing protein [Streptomyces sp. NPDC087845]|uniref:pentapeptide repeat-containing protein n=1 Tax=Streptomyces sp. NPDC087845 TaxID=3365806 RepID=UPI00381C4C5A